MKINEQQYIRLKQKLKTALLSNNTHELNKMAKDAVFFYAQWWQSEYDGGTPGKHNLTDALGISPQYSEILFATAQKGAKQLNINILKRKRTLWFRSLLIQGGLPLKHIKENLSAYKNFLKGLIKHANTVTLNWNDTSFVYHLSCTNYLPASFKIEDIFELSLQITRAIIENNDELFPYDINEQQLKEFTEELKQSSTSNSLRVPFVIKWWGEKHNTQIKLFYSIDCAHKISDSYIAENGLSEFYSISLYANHHFVASYSKTKDNKFVLRDKQTGNIKWNEEPIIDLYLKSETNKIIEITVPNIALPDFDNPVVFSNTNQETNQWQIKSFAQVNSQNALVFSSNWQITKPTPCKLTTVSIHNQNHQWISFNDFIEVKNTETGETLIFDSNETLYSYEFLNWTIEWVQKASQKLLVKPPVIRVYNEDQEKIHHNKYKITYRLQNKKEWLNYTENNLPNGLLEFKIAFPDGKFAKEKFFIIQNLYPQASQMTSENGVIKWTADNGNIVPLNNQKGLEIDKTVNKTWRINRIKTNDHSYPDTVGFRYYPENNTSYADIYVATPFKGIVFLDRNGKKIPDKSLLSSTSLYAYRCIVMGFDNITTRIYHNENPKIVIKEKINQGIHSLSRFENSVNRIFNLFGKETFDIYSKVELETGSCSYQRKLEFRDYNVYSKSEDGKPPIKIVDNRENMQPVEFKGKLQAVPVNCKADDIKVVEMQKKEDEFYFADEDKLEKFIIFTDQHNNNGAHQMVVPRYFDFSGNNQPVEGQNELNPQEKNIQEIKEKLTYEAYQGEEWKKVTRYFVVAVENSLPFKTFNQFRAIVQEPLLLAKMHIQLSTSTSFASEKYMAAMTRFEDNMAVSFHWLSMEKHWWLAIDWFMANIPLSIQQEVLPKIYQIIKNLLDYTLFNQQDDLINSLLDEEETGNITPPSKAELNEIRADIGYEQNLPETSVIIPNEWRCLFPNALNNEIPMYARSFIFSAVKAALAFTGEDDSLWEAEQQAVKRTINFCKTHKPIVYFDIFTRMVIQIKATRKKMN